MKIEIFKTDSIFMLTEAVHSMWERLKSPSERTQSVLTKNETVALTQAFHLI